MPKAIHSMIRVVDLDRSVEFYKRAFDLEVTDKFEFESFTLAYLRNAESEFELELTSNKGREQAYELGDGYGHLAFSVDDIDAEHARMKDAGVKPGDLKQLEHGGKPLARFFFVTDPDGYKIEVLQRGGRYV